MPTIIEEIKERKRKFGYLDGVERMFNIQDIDWEQEGCQLEEIIYSKWAVF